MCLQCQLKGVLQVSLKNIGPFFRALLQKRPIIVRSLLFVAFSVVSERGLDQTLDGLCVCVCVIVCVRVRVCAR